MQFWLIQTLNSVAFGGLLFLLASGFSLIFGLLRVPNLAHGALFMLGAYLRRHAAERRLGPRPGGRHGGGGRRRRLLGAAIERVLLRRLAGNEQGQVLVTLGIAFIIADLCLTTWGGDPMPLPAPPAPAPAAAADAGYAFPDLPPCRARGRIRRGRRAAGAADGAHPAGRHDPRRGG